MPNLDASFSVRLSYIGPDGESITAPNLSITVPYAEGAQMVGGIDVIDTQASGTSYDVAFGAIAEATGLLIENRSGQEVRVRVESAGASVSGTLVSGTATLALAAVPGERLSVTAGDDNGGTPGALTVVRSSGNVVVTSYTTDGVQDADVGDVTVYNNAPIPLPDDATLVIMSPTAPTGAAIAAATVLLTATQSGAASVVTKVFGDPV